MICVTAIYAVSTPSNSAKHKSEFRRLFRANKSIAVLSICMGGSSIHVTNSITRILAQVRESELSGIESDFLDFCRNDYGTNRANQLAMLRAITKNMPEAKITSKVKEFLKEFEQRKGRKNR
jgi:hypothetical protein